MNNNGKVRIYELSKELNLDNKDILAICDRLDIAVKSHSSTIAESQADQIRSAARQSRHAAPKRVDRPRRNASKNGERPKQKQQILEIRRHRTAPKPEKPTPAQPSGAAAPPVAPNKPVVATKATEDLAGSPIRPQPSVADEPATIESQLKPAPSLNRPVVAPVAPATPPRQPETAPAEEKAAELQIQKPKPELVGAPIRPQAKEPVQSEAVASPSRPVKPVVKRPEAKVEGKIEPPRQVIPIREIDETEDDGPKLKPKPKLRRPKPAEPTSREADQKQAKEKEEEDSISVLEVGDLDDSGTKLRRPSPPRHKRKGRNEDEDDERDMRDKASKASKSKRRGQPVIDDVAEEDLEVLEEELNDDGQTSDIAHLSISLARPPKPKKAASGKPSSPTVKSHRPPSRDGGRSSRRDRREEPSKPQRPEILELSEGLTVHELADQIMVPETEIIKSLFFKGIAANINQTLDIETAKMVAEEFDVLVETSEAESEAKKVTEMIDVEDLESLQRRPPVVTIMGHVDHGKTTLLDSIRKTKVAQGEAGGITQHIGAYHVDVEHAGASHQIVFLDTPGHEAFTAMRARGTRVTDIAILVVAADDGVRPQTIEAISHAKAAEVPLIVAVNKVDKETAQPDRVKQELMEHGLVPEEWGGDTIVVPVSALSGENLDTLLEMIVLVAEVEDLQANPDRLARGTIIEANLDKARGPVATLLVQNGTLKVGDVLVAGSVLGKVRAMLDDRLHRVEQASPSFAVEVLGLNEVPAAGDEFEVYPDEKSARAVADARAIEQRQSRLQQAMASRRVTLNSLSAKAQEGDLKELNLLLKADVQGFD
jgi:translation initiation factor IF-2